MINKHLQSKFSVKNRNSDLFSIKYKLLETNIIDGCTQYKKLNALFGWIHKYLTVLFVRNFSAKSLCANIIVASVEWLFVHHAQIISVNFLIWPIIQRLEFVKLAMKQRT